MTVLEARGVTVQRAGRAIVGGVSASLATGMFVALIGDPQVLLADEPISGLDPRHRLDTVVRLRRLALEEGRLVVTTLHDLTLALRHATHLMALREGRLVAFGPVAETLTPQLLAEVFDVRARITGAGAEALVDYLGPA